MTDSPERLPEMTDDHINALEGAYFACERDPKCVPIILERLREIRRVACVLASRKYAPVKREEIEDVQALLDQMLGVDTSEGDLIALVETTVSRWLSSAPPTQSCDGKVYEYDGAFKCYKCGATWGQITDPDPKTHITAPPSEERK